MEDFDAKYKEVWAILAETAAMQREAEVRQKKWAAEAETRWQKWEIESKERHRKLEESLRKANESWGGYTNNEGERLEDEFYEGMRETMQVGAFRLTEVRQRQRAKYEYDLVGINGKAVFVGEIKQNLHPCDVKRFAEERLPHYAEDFPGVARRRKVYGMIGGGRVTPAAAKAAEKHGLLLLRLKNKKLVIGNTENARPV